MRLDGSDAGRKTAAAYAAVTSGAGFAEQLRSDAGAARAGGVLGTASVTSALRAVGEQVAGEVQAARQEVTAATGKGGGGGISAHSNYNSWTMRLFAARKLQDAGGDPRAGTLTANSGGLGCKMVTRDSDRVHLDTESGDLSKELGDSSWKRNFVIRYLARVQTNLTHHGKSMAVARPVSLETRRLNVEDSTPASGRVERRFWDQRSRNHKTLTATPTRHHSQEASEHQLIVKFATTGESRPFRGLRS